MHVTHEVELLVYQIFRFHFPASRRRARFSSPRNMYSPRSFSPRHRQGNSTVSCSLIADKSVRRENPFSTTIR